MAKVPGSFKPRTRIWAGTIPGSHEPGFEEAPIWEFDPPDEIKQMHAERGSLYLAAFTMGETRILLGHEPDDAGRFRWHLTISCEDRHPSWDEIKTARYRLLGPDLVAAMILPKPENYVDAHPHVFQLWELIDEEAEEW